MLRTVSNGYAPGKSHYGSDPQVISATNLNGNVVNVSLYYDGNPVQNEQDWFGNGEWKVLERTLSVDANGEYHHYYDKVTPDMSIAVGIGWYAYKMNEEHGRLTEDEGIKAYNGGGDPDYVNEIDDKINELNEEHDD